MKKKLLEIILAGVMAVLFMPAAASAAQQGNAAAAVWDGSVDITWFTEQPWGTEEEPADYYIETPAQLAGLAYIVNGRLDTEQFPIRYKAGTTEKTDVNVDVTATVEAVVDGTEEDGTTVSGLKAEDLPFNITEEDHRRAPLLLQNIWEMGNFGKNVKYSQARGVRHGLEHLVRIYQQARQFSYYAPAEAWWHIPYMFRWWGKKIRRMVGLG